VIESEPPHPKASAEKFPEGEGNGKTKTEKYHL